MIEHLKKIHNILYLPQAPEPVDLPFKVTPINDPYLYTDTELKIDKFDNPDQSVYIKVSNVGGGKLDVERIAIPRIYGKWVKRAEGSKPITLEENAKPISLELKISLKDLPNFTTANIAELNILSNSKRKTFSKLKLEVFPTENRTAKLSVPDLINFGEITAWKIIISDRRVNDNAPPAEFLLIGNFANNPPVNIVITQNDEFTFHAKIQLTKGQFHYIFNLHKPGIVKPRSSQSGNVINLKSIRQTISISNAHPESISGQVKSKFDWLNVRQDIQIVGFSSVNLDVSVKVDKLETGRNFDILVIDGEEIPVWAWFKVVSETSLTLEQNQQNMLAIEDLPESLLPISINLDLMNETYSSLMIFEDVEFTFPLTDGDSIGYFLGDLNNWTPRVYPLEKRDDRYGITLSVTEGEYLYRAEIDGEMRLDPKKLYEIVCCSHGLASIIKINRYKRDIKFRNKSPRNIKLVLHSDTDFLDIETNIIPISGNKMENITVMFHPEKLQPGLNLGWVHIGTDEEPKEILKTPIYVIGKTNGVVPVLQSDGLIFPRMEQGKKEEIPLSLDIFGEGELKGGIQPSTVLRLSDGNLHVETDISPEVTTVNPLLQVVTDKPFNAYRKEMQAALVTDCYLANRRILPFVAKYEMVHLVTDPPILYFNNIFLFDEPQLAEVYVSRSDGIGKVDCHVEIPEGLLQTGLLKTMDSIIDDSTDHIWFAVNPQAENATKRQSEKVWIKDNLSNMSLPLQFVAEFIQSTAKIDIDVKRQRLRISNIGETDLRIFDVEFENNRFYLSTPLTSQQRTLHPKEFVERNYTIKWGINLIPKTTIHDKLIIKLNDPQFSNGVFEKEIAVDNKNRFLNFKRKTKE